METKDGRRRACPEGSRREARRPNVLLLSAGILVLAVLAMACHKWDRHLASYHSGLGFARLDEWCFWIAPDINRTVGEVQNWIIEALDGPGVFDWEGFVTGADYLPRGDCRQLTGQDLFNVEIEITLTDGAGVVASCGGLTSVACVVPFGSGLSHSNHTNYDKFGVWINEQELTAGVPNRRRHIINHEFAHTLGLDDVTTTSGTGIDRCRIRIDTNNNGIPDTTVPLIAITHDRFVCGTNHVNIPYPTWYDVVMADLIAENHISVR